MIEDFRVAPMQDYPVICGQTVDFKLLHTHRSICKKYELHSKGKFPSQHVFFVMIEDCRVSPMRLDKKTLENNHNHVFLFVTTIYHIQLFVQAIYICKSKGGSLPTSS